MVSEWSDSTIGEFCPFIYGKSLPSTQRDISGKVPVFGSGGVSGFHSKPYVNEKGIIIGRKGTVGSIRWSNEPFWPIDTTFFITENKNSDLKFTYYLLQTLKLNEMNSDSAVPGLNRDAAHAVRIKVPPLAEQKSIAHILGTIDDKIELNRQMNATLEAMAQALFKSWFVDFDPVIDNALAAGHEIPEPLQARAEARAALGDQRRPLPEAIQQQFPSRFVLHDEMGWVPEGWDVEALSNRVHVLNGFAFKSQDYTESGTFILRTRNFDNGVVNYSNDDVYLPKELLSTYENYLCKSFDYHLVMVGTSIGKRGIILPHQLPALRNQNMWCFRSKNKSCTSVAFVKYMLDKLIHEKINLATGSARDFFRKGDFQNQKIIFGSSKIQNEFNDKAMPLLEKLSKNIEQSEQLSKIRNALLPQLLSGQLRVSEAEQLIAEAL